MEEMWLIDAGRLKRILQRFEEHLTAFGFHEGADVVKTIIKGLKVEPKVDAVPVVHGHWFLLDECANAGVYCSVCTKKVYKTNYANQKLKSKYCPNCGARMDGDFIAY